LVDLEPRCRAGPISFYSNGGHVDAAGCRYVADAVAKVLRLVLPNRSVAEVRSLRAARSHSYWFLRGLRGISTCLVGPTALVVNARPETIKIEVKA